MGLRLQFDYTYDTGSTGYLVVDPCTRTGFKKEQGKELLKKYQQCHLKELSCLLTGSGTPKEAVLNLLRLFPNLALFLDRECSMVKHPEGWYVKSNQYLLGDTRKRSLALKAEEVYDFLDLLFYCTEQ